MTLYKKPNASVRNAIEELIEEEEESKSQSIDNDEKLILGNVLNLKDLTAEDVMIPYANIIAVPLEATKEEITTMFAKFGVSQVPVYLGTIDNIVGLLSFKDVLAWMQGKTKAPLKSILREVLYIAPTMKILDLLLQMREGGSRLAIVVDEYGGVAGIVTFASLIENIIGDIQYEEYNTANEQIEVQQNGAIVLNAGTPIEELANSLEKVYGKRFDWLNELDGEAVDTVGGIVTLLAGRVPIKGELILHPLGCEFEVLDADPRRVKKIAIRNIEALQQIAEFEEKAKVLSFEKEYNKSSF
ncbi:MAG: CBS domain-containing protein [Holosporales bacterium]|nr:CBS domain-containing protein [Holosporales bacterium]